MEEEEEEEEVGGSSVGARDAREEQVQPGGRCGGLPGAAAQRGGLPAWHLFPSQGEVNRCACLVSDAFTVHSLRVCVFVFLCRGEQWQVHLEPFSWDPS